MEIEIFTLCDHAQDFGGKLVIVGTFDTINAPSLPWTHIACSIALRIRFNNDEIGNHTLKLRLINAHQNEIIQPVQGNFTVNSPIEGQQSALNIVFNFNQMILESEGIYTFELSLDEQWRKSSPLLLRRIIL